MLDIHNELAALSCEFQREDLVFSEVIPLFESTICRPRRTQIRRSKIQGGVGSIKGVKLSGDIHQSINKVKALMAKYIDKLKENIADILTQKNGDIIHNIGAIFEPAMFD